MVYIHMSGFREWLGSTVGTENVDSKIDHLYDKAKYAIKLVQMYDRKTKQNLLTNISTIADLNMAGTYGLYNSAENKDVIGPHANRTKFTFGQQTLDQYKGNINRLPPAVISQYKPQVDPSQLVPSDVIHVNVREIVDRLGDTKEAVIQIASTIVHECTHQMEFRSTGKTDHTKTGAAETAFRAWAEKNWDLFSKSNPMMRFNQPGTSSIPRTFRVSPPGYAPAASGSR
jgi:hypothetical protein